MVAVLKENSVSSKSNKKSKTNTLAKLQFLDIPFHVLTGNQLAKKASAVK